MGPKKGNATKKKGAVSAEDDDDWDVLLEAQTTASPPAAVAPDSSTPAAESKVVETSSSTQSNSAKNAAAAFLAAQGKAQPSSTEDATAAAKKKKKNKKKGSSGTTTTAGDDDEEGEDAEEGGGVKPSTAPVPVKKTEEKISAKGKLIAERLRKQKEEEDRIRALEEAERQRIAAIEAAEEAERKRIEAEKEAKKKKKLERIEQQKREGTYMTKAQKAKAALNQKRLEATIKAAGIHVAAVSGSGHEDEQEHESDDDEEQEEEDEAVERKPAEEGVKKKKIVYDHKKKKRGGVDTMEPSKKVEDDKQEEETSHPSSANAAVSLTSSQFVLQQKENDEEEDDWENQADSIKPSGTQDTVPVSNKKTTKDDWDAEEDSGDEWDVETEDEDDSNMFQTLDSKLKKLQMEEDPDLDEEDLIQKEKLKEQERLRQLGIERQERERIEAEKRAKMQAEQAELEYEEQLKAQKRLDGKRKREEQERLNLAARTREDLRCPIVVVMGHVDTGKTSLLDKIRKTNVQHGEAGGITQQIGATYFEKKTLEAQTARVHASDPFDITIPGMLVIDTPGHESFSNLRTRGSSLCDVAILVVDLMHGLEQQTIESLNMLRKREIPFVVALNKVDRCYAWKTCRDIPIREALKEQPEGTFSEFRSRALDAKIQLQEQGINSNLYWEMGDEDWTNSDFVPLVPTSAITGEGVQDILQLLCRMAQVKLWQRLMWHANLQATVLEVKAIDGLGMTVDVLVVNGYLREGDRAVFCTLDGPISTEIRGLLTPPPSREMRIKAEYIHHKEIKGALGVKVIGTNLDKVMAGTPVLVIGPDDEEEDIKAEVMSDLTNLQEKLSVDKKGVMVQASTLGALEALLQFLRVDTKPPIPVSAIGIGAIHKRDVTKISIMNEKGFPEYATILAFDVEINGEAREYAQEVGVRIFTADIIYHLFDQFTRFMEDLTERRRQEAAAIAVFPCILKILPQHIFNQKDPIIMGVEVLEGILKVGTPLSVPALTGLHIGKVISIEANGKEQDTAKKGTAVAVKIVNESNPTITYGRQFDATHHLYSTLSRASIDALKAHFKEKLDTDDWKLVIKLKKIFGII